ncbi:LysR family transcriptional regulator [Adlercreutzia sp. ZJ473]|uniref:LysR family transcriptional regulator n=1 Tax=Adlercreutzia sp. ZJ473 TaxID=2722822 RepID=UPI001553F7F6|nr:LysR family transcriptional regulator [Adlercreutzia sp. ZJ473]
MQEYLQLVEAGSFTDAAKQCHVSQSALSKHIASMEDELGIELIKRPSVPLEFTKAGKAFANDVRRIVAEYKSAVARIDAIKRGSSETVTLGYYHDASQQILMDLGTALKRGGVPFEVKLLSLSDAQIKELLKAREIDAAITIDVDEDLAPLCNAVTLKEERMLLAVSKKNPLSRHDRVKLCDLEGEVFLRPESRSRVTITKHLEEVFGALPNYRNGMQLVDVDTVLMSVMNNTGVALVLEHNRSIYGDRIRFIEVVEETQSGYVIPVQFMWLKEAEESRTMRRNLFELKRLFSAAKKRRDV